MDEIIVGGVDASEIILSNGNSIPFGVNAFDIGGIGAKFLFLGVEVKSNQGFLDVFRDVTESTTSHHLQVGACVYF